MDDLETKIIEVNKSKVSFLLLLSVVFVLLGIWLVSAKDDEIQNFGVFRNPFFIHGVGVMSVITFGFFMFGYARKLFDSKPGLEITKDGLYDNSTGISVGLISWNDITSFKIVKVKSQRFLAVMVSNPEKYISRGSSLTRFFRRMNLTMYGSPTIVTSSTLNMNFDELVSILNTYRSRYGNHV
jgi:hypothetical protein